MQASAAPIAGPPGRWPPCAPARRRGVSAEALTPQGPADGKRRGVAATRPAAARPAAQACSRTWDRRRAPPAGRLPPEDADGPAPPRAGRTGRPAAVLGRPRRRRAPQEAGPRPPANASPPAWAALRGGTGCGARPGAGSGTARPASPVVAARGAKDPARPAAPCAPAGSDLPIVHASGPERPAPRPSPGHCILLAGYARRGGARTGGRRRLLAPARRRAMAQGGGAGRSRSGAADPRRGGMNGPLRPARGRGAAPEPRPPAGRGTAPGPRRPARARGRATVAVIGSAPRRAESSRRRCAPRPGRSGAGAVHPGGRS